VGKQKRKHSKTPHESMLCKSAVKAMFWFMTSGCLGVFFPVQEWCASGQLIRLTGSL